jgi:hypothetical protein
MAHPGGRPLLYKTPEEMKVAIDEYFEWCDNRIIKGFDDKTGKEFAYISPAPYTMSGLARRLGMDRRTLVDYTERDQFLPTIKAARERVHEDVETRLMEKTATGAIFNLKNNFGWKDESKIENTVVLPKPLLENVDVKNEKEEQSGEA